MLGARADVVAVCTAAVSGAEGFVAGAVAVADADVDGFGAVVNACADVMT